jgi:hypothetical protein
MFFPECEHLAKLHPDLASDIAVLDERLRHCSLADTINPGILASFLELDVNRLNSILELLVQAGALQSYKAFFCPRCQNTIYLRDHLAALSDGGESACTQCDGVLEESPANVFEVFRLRKTQEAGPRAAAHDIAADATKRKSLTGNGDEDQGVRVDEVIVLLHGIRTHAEWQEMVRRVLERIPHTKVIPLKYGFFDAFRFWFPGRLRRKPIDELRWRIRDAHNLYPGARLSAIAHSYGTYAICQILDDDPGMKLGRLVLCGSILSTSLRWDKMRRQITSEIINECGIRDIWPVLAESTTWGYGASGTFGFGAPGVHDRYHHCGHSDYFTEQMVADYWLPWFQTQAKIHTGHDKRSPYLWSFLTIIKLKYWVPTLLLIAGACLGVGYWLAVR